MVVKSVLKRVYKSKLILPPQSDLSATATARVWISADCAGIKAVDIALFPLSISLFLTPSPHSPLLWNSGLANDSMHVYICKLA